MRYDDDGSSYLQVLKRGGNTMLTLPYLPIISFPCSISYFQINPVGIRQDRIPTVFSQNASFQRISHPSSPRSPSSHPSNPRPPPFFSIPTFLPHPPTIPPLKPHSSNPNPKPQFQILNSESQTPPPFLHPHHPHPSNPTPQTSPLKPQFQILNPQPSTPNPPPLPSPFPPSPSPPSSIPTFPFPFLHPYHFPPHDPTPQTPIPNPLQPPLPSPPSPPSLRLVDSVPAGREKKKKRE